jgi:lysophospholipase L1-like esterase
MLCIGSSHIRRFSEFINPGRPSHEVFDIQGLPQVHFHGISGARVGNPRHLREFSSVVRNLKPAHLIVHLGGNDLDSVQNNIEATIYGLLAFTSQLTNQHNLRSVTIIRLMLRQRTRYTSVAAYNARVIDANVLLKEQCRSSGMIYWRLKGFTNSNDNILLDGVHLNSLGMRKYFRQLRGIIMKNFHSINY